MRNNYLGQIEVRDGYGVRGHDGPKRIVHLVEILDGPDYSYIIYAVHETGFYTYAM
jgi:hypothetical protein